MTQTAKAPRTGAVSSAIMASGTMLSRILGFVKTILITWAIGTGTAMGTIFETANTLPNLIYVLVAGGIFNAVLVPQIIKAAKHDDGGSDFISRLVTLATTGIAAVTVVVLACSWPIISVMGQQWTNEQRALGLVFALWCLPQIFFYGFYTIIGQVLNARGAFGWYMWSPVINNVVAIAALILFIVLFGRQTNTTPPLHDVSTWTSAQTLVLAGSATLGVAIQALILLFPLKRLGLKLRPKFGWRGIGLGASAKLAGWTLATGIISNLAFFYLTKTASNIISTDGTVVPGIQSLNYSSMLYSLPHGVIGLSIATYLFNKMSAASQDSDDANVVAALSSGLRVSSLATVFLAVALVVFAGPVGMLFGNGNQISAAMIGQTVAIMALGGPFLTIAFMMGRVLYAQEDAKTPFFIQLASAIFVVILGFASSRLDPGYIVFGLSATYALQNIIAVVLNHFVLKRRFGDYDVANIVSTHARVALASFCAGLVGALVLWMLGGYTLAGFAWGSIINALITIVVGGVVMGIAYLFFLQLFRVQEIDILLDPLRRKLPFLKI
ncbi:murein biosynthesis integral membrane protein MurJ [Rothia aerolata]|uniref:Lipid II flippase MurJ n=1 Tax=Rothia aerolata TaxID=1812262 RepID=A0A917MVH3_9MICC|nr:murein biosynthesis integral membrane protein MurJ [Rothia aerolata]GGH66643.1 lipid II flippase MurJ [Rothia aerolata]